ncbi:MAG: hypothetical protein WC817_01715 [Patescibacteria group bacterium]|jgi:hypothetical protein
MAKYGSLTGNQNEKLIDLLGCVYGGDGLGAVNAILAGAKVTIEEVISMFFDRHGRRIPPRGIKAKVCDANRAYHLLQPEVIDYAARRERMDHAFEGNIVLPDAAWFEDEVGRLMVILDDSSVVNVGMGVHLPIIVPQMVVHDHGQMLEFLLSALERAYKAEFPGRGFTNHRRGQLEGQVTVVPESRLDLLLVRAKEGPIATIELPCATQGFSVHAQREQMATLPEGFILNGFNAILSAIMWPEVICRDNNTPVIDLSAYQWQSAEYSLYLLPHDEELEFDNRTALAHACDDSSGGVSFLG